MKNIVIIALLLCLSQNIYSANKLNLIMTYKDGRTFDTNTPILPSDVITFDSGNHILNWTFALETEERPFEQAQIKYESTNIDFCVDSIPVKWSNAVKFHIGNNANTIYRGYLIYESSGLDEYSILDTIPLLLNLAPATPKIINTELHYDDFNPETFEFTNQLCYFDLYCEGNPHSFACLFTIADPPEEEFEEMLFMQACSIEVEPNDSNRYSIITTDWGWRQYIKLMAHNKYGFSFQSDTILTCDYIKNQEVFDAWNALNSVSQPDIPDISINICNKQLKLNTIVDEISVYDTLGKLLARKEDIDSMDLSLLNSQLFIIQIKHKKHTTIKKIIL